MFALEQPPQKVRLRRMRTPARCKRALPRTAAANYLNVRSRAATAESSSPQNADTSTLQACAPQNCGSELPECSLSSSHRRKFVSAECGHQHAASVRSPELR